MLPIFIIVCVIQYILVIIVITGHIAGDDKLTRLYIVNYNKYHQMVNLFVAGCVLPFIGISFIIAYIVKYIEL